MAKLKNTPKESYASFNDTFDALKSLRHENKLRVDLSGVNEDCGDFVLRFKCGDEWRVTKGQIYQCGHGYYCVSVDDRIWQAPVVWNGPRASWDVGTNDSLLREFAAFVLEALETS